VAAVLLVAVASVVANPARAGEVLCDGLPATIAGTDGADVIEGTSDADVISGGLGQTSSGAWPATMLSGVMVTTMSCTAAGAMTW